MTVHAPFDTGAVSIVEKDTHTLWWYDAPAIDITETNASAKDPFRMIACLDLEEPLPPPKSFDRCLRSKSQPRKASKVILEISGEGNRFISSISSLQAPTSRPVYNRNIGFSFLDPERKDIIIPNCGVNHSIELDAILRAL